MKLEELINNGVIIKDKNNIYIDDSVQIGKGTILYPGVSLRGNTKIGNDCIIDMGCIIEDSSIGDNNKIGPFAHLHTSCVLGDGNIIGNYVEIKKSRIGNFNQMKHLTYCGDAIIGNYCNIGCGVVFSNYNYSNNKKEVTTLEDYVFVGSNSVLCAPLKIGDHSVIGAGSVITEDVSSHSLAVARSRQITREDYFKEKKV